MPENSEAVRPSSPAAITIAGREIPLRVCLFWGGVTFWIGNTLLNTGTAGFVALWASFAFVIEMLVITSATRTVPISRVTTFCCWGGAMMSVVWVIDYVFTMFQPNGSAMSRVLFTPFIEETLKIAPVAFYLWRHRQAESRTMGASDILLLAAASGAGFGLVEDAFIQHNFGVWHAVSWFPTTALNGASLVVGHQIWSSISGIALGLALLWFPRKPLVYVLGASGILWSMLDHLRNNVEVGQKGFIVNFLNFAGGHGWYSLYLFVIGVIAVIGTDLYAERDMLSSRPQLKLQGGKPPAGYGGNEGFLGLWAFLKGRRALAYVLLRCKRASEPTKEMLTRYAAELERRLMKRSANPVLPRGPAASAAN